MVGATALGQWSLAPPQPVVTSSGNAMLQGSSFNVPLALAVALAAASVPLKIPC